MKLKNLPTWAWELSFVGSVLFSTIWYNGFSKTEILSGLAVLFTFCHAQISDRMAEKQAKMVKPDVSCYRWSAKYFLAKEVLWIAFFICVGSYSAIVGSVLFAAYPFWRKMYREIQEIAKTME